MTVLLAIGTASAQKPEELNFTSSIGELRDISRGLPDYLIAETKKSLSNRPQISSWEALNARRDLLRRAIIQNVGGLPEKTPLNAKTVGTIERGLLSNRKGHF